MKGGHSPDRTNEASIGQNKLLHNVQTKECNGKTSRSGLTHIRNPKNKVCCIYTQGLPEKNGMVGHAAGDPNASLPKMALHGAARQPTVVNGGNRGEHRTLPLPNWQTY